MKFFLFLLGANFFYFFIYFPLHALEVYSIIYENCRTFTGLIIDVEEKDYQLLDKNGSFLFLPKEKIESILIFNIVENPISKVLFQNDLNTLPKKVTVQGSPDFSFIGWPIRFLEELIVFFDINGKTHLIHVEQIKGFEVSKTINAEPEIMLQYTHYEFGFGNNMPECVSSEENFFGRVQPTRMLSDKISISKFLSVYQKGFSQLKRLQKRTGYYARPYLYDRQTKISFVIENSIYKAEIPQGIPLNYQWSTGRNFGPQGTVTLGSIESKLLPNVESLFCFVFSGKYHLLSLNFAGNLWAFSYGDDYIIKNRIMFYEFFSKYNSNQSLVFPQFNQIAITGFDIGQYSLAGGLFYPIIGIQGNFIFRELLSEESSPLASLKYITDRTENQILLSLVRLKSSNPSESNIKLINAEEMVNEVSLTLQSEELMSRLDDFDLNSFFLRVNHDRKLDENMNLGFSEVYFAGKYYESFSGANYKLDFNQLITSLKIEQIYGDYVSLKFNLNYFIRKYYSRLVDDKNESVDNKISFAVAIEFFL